MEYPEIRHQESSENTVTLSLFIGEELNAFKGHFDSAPIVPGVVQIKWVIEFAKRYLCNNVAPGVDSIEKLKFQQVIQPGNMISLQIELSNNKLLFSFSAEEDKYSSGKIVIA